jgi:ubiquinone/menaquinone biosynthesis C-methylase UbiE
MEKHFIENILIDPTSLDPNLKLYNYSEISDSANFYQNQFSTGAGKPKEEKPDFSKVPKEMNELMLFLKNRVDENAIVLELGGSRYQHRSGYPNYIFKNYIPLDISYSSIKGYVETYDKYGIAADACKLPFKNNSIDVVFTHTFLEHPLKPEDVLSEINRVLKPGGYVIHSDAWNCRWWQHYGVVGIKKFNELTIKEKFIYLAAKFTELKVLRFSAIVLKRFFRLLFQSKKSNIELKYGKLTPNYNLYLYCDEDAASSIDPVDVMLFYGSRNYKIIPEPNLMDKLFFRNLNIYFQKSDK